MKFNAVLTKEQAKEMFAYLEEIFTEVKVLDIEAVRRLEKDKNSISLKAFRERCQKKDWNTLSPGYIRGSRVMWRSKGNLTL